MRTFIQTFRTQKFFSYCFYGKFVKTICIKKFFKIQRIHLRNRYTSHRDRRSIRQRYAKQRAARYIGKPVILFQKFKQREKMRILLNFIKKNQSAIFIFHFLAGKHTYL